MDAQPDPEPPPTWLLIIEVPVRGVLLGHVQLFLPEPADPIVGWTTTDDSDWE